MYKLGLKRVLDFLFALCYGILLLPVFFVLVVVLMISNKGSAFFTQLRPGKNEKVFKLIKFRTMNNGTDKNGDLLPDAQRLTKTGRFIRSTSLDEIPQLINVIKGDMSIIGPRPLLVRYLDRYSTEQRRRHEVRPGITGWAQVNGRNFISWEKKFELDVFYVDNFSFKLDLLILIKTIQKIVVRHGVTATGHATIEEFKG